MTRLAPLLDLWTGYWLDHPDGRPPLAVYDHETCGRIAHTLAYAGRLLDAGADRETALEQAATTTARVAYALWAADQLPDADPPPVRYELVYLTWPQLTSAGSAGT